MSIPHYTTRGCVESNWRQMKRIASSRRTFMDVFAGKQLQGTNLRGDRGQNKMQQLQIIKTWSVLDSVSILMLKARKGSFAKESLDKCRSNEEKYSKYLLDNQMHWVLNTHYTCLWALEKLAKQARLDNSSVNSEDWQKVVLASHQAPLPKAHGSDFIHC